MQFDENLLLLLQEGCNHLLLPAPRESTDSGYVRAAVKKALTPHNWGKKTPQGSIFLVGLQYKEETAAGIVT